MENYGETRREERLPGEVVEVYRQPDPREVVETYVRPLPGVSVAARTAPEAPRKKHRKGLWIFLACLAGAALLTAAALVVRNLLVQEHRDDFEWYYEEYDSAETTKDVTIPTYPTGQGAELVVQREHGESKTAQEIYQLVNPSVVTVMVQLERDDRVSVGTGVIFTEDGYLITNYHVVEGGRDCVIALDTGYSYQAK